jgi:hypothetical protein
VAFNPFDPLTDEQVLRNLTRELDTKPFLALSDWEQIRGSGVYLLYYTGQFLPYREISRHPSYGATPIYVGKAISRAADPSGSKILGGRVRQHAESLDSIENLQVSDFQVKYLDVKPRVTRACEDLLIDAYEPLWNSVLTGFGNHKVGVTRSTQRRSFWDEVHPGRVNHSGQAPCKLSSAEIMGRVRRHLAAQAASGVAKAA